MEPFQTNSLYKSNVNATDNRAVWNEPIH